MSDKEQEYRYRRVNLRDDELKDKRLFQQACVVVGQKEKVDCVVNKQTTHKRISNEKIQRKPQRQIYPRK